MSRHCLLLSLCITAFVLSPLGVAGTRSAGGSSATLKNVAASLDKRTGLVTIEASAPVAYVAVQPDARTTIVEMRDVATTGFARDVKVDEHHPVDSVQVENATTSDGAAIARVRITFRQPIRPRIRSSRNLILVEADRVDGTAAVGPKLDADGYPPAIHDVRVTQRGTATAVTLRGKGPLMATSVQEPKEGPRRIVVNLGSVTSTVPGNTAVKGGPVERVRVGMSPTPPFDTQVTMELSRTAPYRLETSADGNDLSVVFDEPPADPIAALRTAATTPRPAAAAVVAAAPAPQLQAAQAQAPQQPVQAVPAQARPQFTGAPISIDFTDADLRGVLTLLGTENGLNLYIDPRVQGTVTVNAKEIPWDEAFDLIASSNGLGYVQRGSVVRVAPLAVLAEEEAARRKVEEERALSGELRTLTKTLSYGNAEDLAATVKATILSPRGDVQIDKRTNTVIITDLSDRLQRAADLLTTLDQPEQQVEIEARIVQTTRDFARSVGIQWGLSGRVAPDLGNTTPLTFPNQGSISGRTGAAQGPDAVGTAVDLGVTGATSAVGLSLGAINGALNLDVVLSALERSGKGKILSTPRVATQNNVEAEIMQGIQVPVPTIANNTVTVTFKDAALILRVLPQITAANTVIMRIVVENASPDFSREVNNIPPIDTQKATTSVRVGDGQTTVIGGVYISREQATQGRTPGLSNIPLLGYLFKRNTYSDESRELLIFITPRIIRL